MKKCLKQNNQWWFEYSPVLQKEFMNDKIWEVRKIWYLREALSRLEPVVS
jgi:hypothetical protein